VRDERVGTDDAIAGLQNGAHIDYFSEVFGARVALDVFWFREIVLELLGKYDCGELLQSMALSFVRWYHFNDRI